jgi:hypothetical protein
MNDKSEVQKWIFKSGGFIENKGTNGQVVDVVGALAGNREIQIYTKKSSNSDDQNFMFTDKNAIKATT